MKDLLLTDILSQIPVLGSVIIPEYFWTYYPVYLEVYDLGGTGDCLIKVFQRYLTENDTYSLTTKKTYDTLSLDINTYLEDDHLCKLLDLYKLNALIFRIQDNKKVFCWYNRGCDKTIMILNFYPNHFLWITKLTINGVDFSFDIDRELISEKETEIFTDLIYLNDQQEYKIEINDYNISYSIMVSTIDINMIFCYFNEVNNMVFPDIWTVIDNFYYMHNLFLRSLSELNNLDLIPKYDVMKSYMKFRHNSFSFLCKKMISDEMFPFDTDVSLERYLPGCKKTPDYVFEDRNQLILYEFTVGSSYDKIDYYKGGGNFAVKYSSECKEMEILLKKKCSVRIVPCVLNSYNVNEILDLINVKDFEKYSGLINDFIKYCNTDRDIINSNLSASLQQIKPNNSNLIPNYPVFDRPIEQRIQMLPADFLNNFAKGRFILQHRIDDLKSGKFDINFNVNNMQFYLQKNIRGYSIDQLYEYLNLSIPELLLKVKFYDQNKVVKLEEMSGTIPVTIPVKKIRKNMSLFDYVPRTDSFFDKKFEGECTTSIFQTDLVNFPPNYFDQLCNMDISELMKYKGNKMLYNCKVDHNELKMCENIFQAKMTEVNSLIVLKPKPTFLYPFVSYPLKHAQLDDFNNDMLNSYLKFGKGIYTKNIIKRLLSKNFATSKKREFTDELRNAYETYHNDNAEYFSEARSLNQGKMLSFKLMTADVQMKLKNLRIKLNDSRKNYVSLLGKNKQILSDRLIKLNCGKSSNNRKDFELEINHYINKIPNSGVGLDSEIANFGDYLTTLINRMLDVNFSGENYHEIYNKIRNPGPQLLNDLKNQYTERWDTFYSKHVKGTMLQQICIFNERLSKFLFNESLKTYNSDYIKVDNLGFDNIIVFCRGGPKLYKHQRSRMFRVMFKIDKSDLLFTGYKENNNFEYCENEDSITIMAPWSQIHQDVLFDFMSLSFRVFNQLYSIYTRSFHNFDFRLTNLMMLPLILSLHNRRKTEKFMHNCRYLIVNPLGFAANLTGIIPSFADINYTYLDAWLRNRIQENYYQFGSLMLNVRDSGIRNIERCLDTCKVVDLWFGEPLTNSDQLTLFIYATYMMSKAPVNSSIEQASNLWEILEDVKTFNQTHPLVDGLNDESLRFNVLNFDENVYEDDFKYDPIFCQYLGHYMGNYLHGSFQVGEIQNKWDQLKTQDIDTFANSNGLRGWKKSNFFNKKGYEIIYEKINEIYSDNTVITMIEDYLEMDLITASENIKTDKVSLDKLNPRYDSLIFHVVHKIQRGGGREIFCMDLNTKSLQNPIERMFKFLCQRVPNEFISIPSNKRHNIIHSDFYEKPVGGWVKRLVRWVLDCRRWAPHSVFQKFSHFCIGMKNILPADFIEHFQLFCEGMFIKKFITRTHVIDKIKNNKKFLEYSKLTSTMNEIDDAIAISVKFSFVMGIFNYLSTLMHASNQLLASEIIRNQCLKNDLGLVILDPKCHSDDSVVTSYHEKNESVPLTAKLYDWLLKGGNHMLSIKKSQLNNNLYLEFLSTLYLFDRFLPVFPKFTSSIPFKPTDNGFSSDISFAISQSIEMLSNGGTFEECFLILKTTEKFIQKIYSIEPVDGLPFQFLGHLDSHPLELVHSGSLAEILKFYLYDSEKLFKALHLLVERGFIKTDSPDFSLNWDMGAFLSNKIRRRFNYLEKFNDKTSNIKWTIENCKLGNGVLNLLWYYNKLKNRKFRSALLDEPVARRYSRIFGAGSYRRIILNDNSLVEIEVLNSVLLKLDELSLNDITIETIFENYLNFMSQDLKDFYSSMNGSEIIGNEISNLKDKPVLLTTGQSFLGNIKLSSSEYVSYLKEPDGYKLLGKAKNPHIEANQITEHLGVLGINVMETPPDILNVIVRKIMSYSEKNLRIIAPVSGENRNINNFSLFLKLIEYNSFPRRKLTIKNKKAAEVDWSKRMLAGRLPQSAKDYMSRYWMCKILTEYNLQDLDIFFIDPFEEEKKLAFSLTDEWKQILLTSTSSESYPLINLNHWIYWENEQRRIGRRWFGEGLCIVKIPESNLKIKISNGKVTSISIESEFTGIFTTSSSWYLHNLLNFSGINADFSNSDFGSPNQIYLGYISKNSTYGIGRAKMFDFLIDNVVFSTNLLPSFCYKELKRKRIRNHYIYSDSDHEYYIDFFVPTEDPASINFSGIFDLEKVKNNKENLDLQRFIKNISIDMGGLMTIDKEQLLNNIGATTLYKIIYESEDRNKLINNEKIQDYLLNAIQNWRKTHVNFGFPSEEDLSILMKSVDLPPFPRKIFEALLRVGKSNISELDFQNLLLKMMSLEGEERMYYLQNNFQFFDKEMRVESLVMASKSKHIYDACYFLGDESPRLILPTMNLIAKCIEQHNLISPNLRHLQRNLKISKNRNYSLSYIFLSNVAKTFLDTVYCHSSIIYLVSFKRLYTVITELIDDGMLPYLNLIDTDDILLRTIDFNVNKATFLDWIVNLFSSNMDYRYQSKIKLDQNIRDVIKKSEWVSNKFSQILPFLSRFKYNLAPKNLIFLLGRKKVEKKVLKLQKGEPGPTKCKFFIMDEDSKDEFECGYMYDEDILDECHEDPDGELQEFGYVNVPTLDWNEITGKRGTAFNVFFKSFVCTKEILSIWGTKTLFKKNIEFDNIFNYLENESDYILLTSMEEISVQIPGYRKLTWEETMREIRANDKFVPSVKIENKIFTREEVSKSSKLRDKVSDLDHYFKSISVNKISETLQQLEENVNKIIEYDDNPKLKEYLDNLNKLIESLKTKEVMEEENENKTENETEKSNISSVLKSISVEVVMEEIAKLEGVMSMGGAITKTKEFMSKDFKTFQYQEPMKLLTDIEFKSEFNTIFPGYIDKLMNGEIRMSVKTKKRVINYASGQIALMQRPLKPKFKKLLLIIKAILNMVDECNFRENEDFEFAAIIDDLFDLDLESSDSDLDDILDLIPDNVNKLIEFDLSKIL